MGSAPDHWTTLAEMSRRCHPHCVACGTERPDGLGLRFSSQPDGSVRAGIKCSAAYQGYPDRLHGGILAMLVDAAMTHCLFAQGVAAVTAKLEITFRHPVMVGNPAEVRAWPEPPAAAAYVVRAEVRQGETVCVAARGLFAEAAGRAL